MRLAGRLVAFIVGNIKDSFPRRKISHEINYRNFYVDINGGSYFRSLMYFTHRNAFKIEQLQFPKIIIKKSLSNYVFHLHFRNTRGGKGKLHTRITLKEIKNGHLFVISCKYQSRCEIKLKTTRYTYTHIRIRQYNESHVPISLININCKN